MTTATMERSVAATSGPDISKTTVLVKLEMHSFGNSRKLRQSQYEVDGADKSMTSASRKLLKSPELVQIRRLMGEARGFVVNSSLPFPIDAIHMVPYVRAEEVNFQLKRFAQKIEAAIEAFVETYDARVEEARAANPKVFNPLDYPPKSSVRKEFDFSYQFITIGVPEQQLHGLNPELIAESRRNCERLWADAAEMTRQMQVEIMQELVGHLRERLEDDGSGKPKRFTSSTVENLTDFLRQFQSSMNVTEFSALGKLVQEAHAALRGSTAETLKDSAIQRDRVRQELAAIEKKLVPLIVERKFRKGEE
jgi:hypothetical protein